MDDVVNVSGSHDSLEPEKDAVCIHVRDELDKPAHHRLRRERWISVEHGQVVGQNQSGIGSGQLR